jgi:hypothetical protein
MAKSSNFTNGRYVGELPVSEVVYDGARLVLDHRAKYRAH